MTSLNNMQRMVQDAVFETQPDGPALQAISANVLATPGMSSTEHVLIYKQAILSTLVRALSNIYPVCERLVGKEFFAGMARKYAYQTPSRSPDLANYGDAFAVFIAGFEPAASLPYLPDIANLEWHWHRAFHAQDEAAMDIATLTEIDEADKGRVIFRLPVSAQLISSNYPIQRIWQVNQADWNGSQAIDLDEGRCRLIVWRQEYDMRIDEMDDPAWQLLTHIANQTSLGALAECPDMEGLDTLLPLCVQRGWIAGFGLSQRTTG